jgi:hypothetical protein
MATTGVVVLIQTDPGGPAAWLFGVPALAAAVISPWLLAFRPRVILTENTLTIVNPLRVTSLRLDQISQRVEPGYAGITVVALNGDHLTKATAWAVQKSNLATWTGSDTRADEVCRVIRQAAADKQGRTIEQ